MKILLTGGSGYIGSHVAVQALSQKHDVAILDNNSTSSRSTIEAIAAISGRQPIFFQSDVRNKPSLTAVFKSWTPDIVLHLAGLKSADESIYAPNKYYENNVLGTSNLTQVMEEWGCKRLVFSSSASVYGVPRYLPIDENHPRSAINPYGQTKLEIEDMLSALAQDCSGWSIMSLRCFNPIGAHSSGLIGDSPVGKSSNILSHITRVAAGEMPYIEVFGDDYETRDGTGVRDYIHVDDVAHSHLQAANWVTHSSGIQHLNIGTGCGLTVREIIAAFEAVNDVKVKVKVVGRRPGEVGNCYALCDKAHKLIGFSARRTLEEMLASSWNMEKKRQLAIREGGIALI